MPNLKISEHGWLADLAVNDLLAIVDVSISTTRKVTIADLLNSDLLTPRFGTLGIGIGTFGFGEKFIVKGGAYNSAFVNADYIDHASGASLHLIFGAASGATYTRLCALTGGGAAWGTMTLQDGGGAVVVGATAVAGSEVFRANGISRFDGGMYVIAPTGFQAISSSTTTNTVYTQYVNAGGSFYVGRDNSAGGTFSGVAYASVLYSEGNYPLVFLTAATERMRILGTGAVLVGVGISTTVTGTEQLVVSNNAAADTGGIVLYNANTSGYGSRISFNAGFHGGYAFGAIESENYSTGGTLRIYTADTSHNLQRAVHINELQQMSIGTGATPAFRLHIGGGSGSNYIVLDSGGNGGSDYSAVYGRNASATALWKIAGNANSGAFAIGVGSSYDERIQVDYSTGLVNITAALQSPTYWVGAPESTYGGKLYRAGVSSPGLIYCGIPGTTDNDLFYLITSAGSGAIWFSATGNMYGSGNCSFLSFTDRTPYPKDKEEAWAAIKSMRYDGKGSVDHKKLHSFIKHVGKTHNAITNEQEDYEGRDMSATISALVSALQDAEDRIAKLEKK